MKPSDRLSDLMKQWQLNNPHTRAKFVSDTLRAIRTRETRPVWKIARDRWLERVDSLILEWLPAPRALVPVAAALILFVTLIRWTAVDARAEAVAALRWQQDMSQPMGRGSLAGGYAQFMKE